MEPMTMAERLSALVNATQSEEVRNLRVREQLIDGLFRRRRLV